MNAAHLTPDRAQVLCADRDLDVHALLNRLDIPETMAEAADAAGALRNVDILVEISLLYKILQPAVDEADGRNDIHNLLILKDKIQVDRFWKNRMLRSERDNASLLLSLFHHFSSFFPDASFSSAAACARSRSLSAPLRLISCSCFFCSAFASSGRNGVSALIRYSLLW